jgi:hypothetical protein
MYKFFLITAFTLALLCMGMGASNVADAQEVKKCATVHEGPVAIFIEPTDEEREALKKERGEEDFDTIADDIMWYDWRATEFLSKRDIPFCFTTEEHHEFITVDDKRYSVDKECRYWCLLLWNGKDEPVYTDSIDIDMYEDYLMGE